MLEVQHRLLLDDMNATAKITHDALDSAKCLMPWYRLLYTGANDSRQIPPPVREIVAEYPDEASAHKAAQELRDQLVRDTSGGWVWIKSLDQPPHDLSA